MIRATYTASRSTPPTYTDHASTSGDATYTDHAIASAGATYTDSQFQHLVTVKKNAIIQHEALLLLTRTLLEC